MQLILAIPGIYVVTLGFCLQVLLCDDKPFGLKRRKDIKWGMLIAALSMAVFGTLDGWFILNNVWQLVILYLLTVGSRFRSDAQHSSLRLVYWVRWRYGGFPQDHGLG